MVETSAQPGSPIDPAMAPRDATASPSGSVTRSSPADARRVNPIVVTAALALATAGLFAVYQRIGTRANADVIEFTQNLAGGFLAIGTTDDQPGFVVLSALDQQDVDVSAVQSSNTLAGRYTAVSIATPKQTAHVRLRAPHLFVIDSTGTVQHVAVDWTLDDFTALRRAADCSHAAALKHRRCGAPFADLSEATTNWPASRIPLAMRGFLSDYHVHPNPTTTSLEPKTGVAATPIRPDQPDKP